MGQNMSGPPYSDEGSDENSLTGSGSSGGPGCAEGGGGGRENFGGSEKPSTFSSAHVHGGGGNAYKSR
eukprot:CAMPEP_0113893794 /NCGR_PEP_ID=MMETSP0780_2-20120614/16308_1 /TAXON_ID=652834 /ORGANISM="Palpitomonas bilix" /LENGTH=67 /DNA_ID=CAMNT_0000884159 /DNA_START=131 /DNA_END=334 /DNA_ORIENTATION=- /assembly_acc=CAM_ASM_000599